MSEPHSHSDHGNCSGHAHSHEHKHEHHGHHHAHVPQKLDMAFFIAICFNLAYFIIQVFFAFHAHSNSLLADAGHNFGDILGLGFSLLALKFHQKSPSKYFSYGFKKMSILASMTNALILFFTCGVIAYDAILKLLNPSAVMSVDVMIIAFIGIFVNGGTALLFMKGQEDLNVRSAFLHLAYDALVSFGVVVGAGIITLTHFYLLDPLLGILIVGVVLWGSFNLFKSSLKLVMDGVPPGIEPQEIQTYLENHPEIQSVHDLHVWALSTQENILTAHILPKAGVLDDALLKELNLTLEKEFRIHHCTIQFEKEYCERSC